MTSSQERAGETLCLFGGSGAEPLSARVLADFAGRWALTRSIVPAQGQEARFEGEAVWTPEGEGLAYEERGVLRVAGQPEMQAERRYRWDAGLNATA